MSNPNRKRSSTLDNRRRRDSKSQRGSSSSGSNSRNRANSLPAPRQPMLSQGALRPKKQAMDVQSGSIQKSESPDQTSGQRRKIPSQNSLNLSLSQKLLDLQGHDKTITDSDISNFIKWATEGEKQVFITRAERAEAKDLQDDFKKWTREWNDIEGVLGAEVLEQVKGILSPKDIQNIANTMSNEEIKAFLDAVDNANKTKDQNKIKLAVWSSQWAIDRYSIFTKAVNDEGSRLTEDIGKRWDGLDKIKEEIIDQITKLSKEQLDLGPEDFDSKFTKLQTDLDALQKNKEAIDEIEKELNEQVYGFYDNFALINQETKDVDVNPGHVDWNAEKLSGRPEQIKANQEREEILSTNPIVRKTLETLQIDISKDDWEKIETLSGMPKQHLRAFLKVAKLRDEIIMTRPVNSQALDLLKADFATKNLHIKSKSSDWGPMAGMIPVDGRLSKAGNPNPGKQDQRDEEQQRKSTEAASESIQQGWAKKKELTMEDKEKVAMWKPGEPGTAKFYSNTNRQNLESKGYAAIEVLADPTTDQPIAPDVDLFAIGPKRRTQGQERDPSAEEINDTHMGTLPIGNMATVTDLNVAVNIEADYKGGRVSHHGPETSNPYTELDFPLTAFLPSEEIKTIKNQQELIDFFNEQNKAGYELTPNSKWFEDDPNKKRTKWEGRKGEYKLSETRYVAKGEQQ